MSDLKTLIRESKIPKREFVANTVRIPKELQSFIEGLTDQLSISKQDVMLKLLEEGAKVAEIENNKNEPVLDESKTALILTEEDDKSSSFHILNTNKRNDLSDHKEMLEKGFASAFYSPWKFNINRIKSGDTVFLYENGVGIIAFGKGSGETLKKDKYDEVDGCHYQILSEFQVLDKAIPASEIKKILGKNVVFLKTMSGMPDGQKIIDFLKEN